MVCFVPSVPRFIISRLSNLHLKRFTRLYHLEKVSNTYGQQNVINDAKDIISCINPSFTIYRVHYHLSQNKYEIIK